MYRQTILLLSLFVIQVLSIRPPSIPLIVNSPYTSVWQDSDNLYSDYARHWNGNIKSFFGMLLVNDQCYRFWGRRDISNFYCHQTMTQKSVEVKATQTIITFEIPDVLQLKMSFTTPAKMDDLSLLSLPITYIDFDVFLSGMQSKSVQLYYDNTAEIAVNDLLSQVEWQMKNDSNYHFMKVGNPDQTFNNDYRHDNINWGYFHVVVPQALDTKVTMAFADHCRTSFAMNQTLPKFDDDMPRNVSDRYIVQVVKFDFGVLTHKNRKLKYIIVAYDEGQSMDYFGTIFQALWKHEWKSIENLTQFYGNVYNKIKLQTQLSIFDTKIKTDLMNSFEGNQSSKQKYAEIGQLAYRQVTGSLLLAYNSVLNTTWCFMKEISSDGDVSTVDVIYPAFPIFYYLNPDLFFIILQPILDYANNQAFNYGKNITYNQEFAPHHLGTWPVCDTDEKQQENMPIEESSNLIILIQIMSKQNPEKYLQKFEPYFDLIDKWGNYLVSVLPDPENQLTTDDFEGPSPHNINLAAKGILAIAAYSQFLQLRMNDDSEYYKNVSITYYQYWKIKSLTKDKSHYKMQYDLDDSWSIKYNLAIQKVLGIDLFCEDILKLEMNYYLGKANEYGIPHDNRANFTKPDWQMWAATMGTDQQFENILNMLYYAYNDTEDRVPMTDWFDTVSARLIGFIARPTVGAFWFKVYLKSIQQDNNQNNIQTVKTFMKL